jgi:hypothetical protein
MDEILKKMSEIELQLRAERMEILSLLRDEKERQLLLMMLENNVHSLRRVRAFKETVVAREVRLEEEEEEKPTSALSNSNSNSTPYYYKGRVATEEEHKRINELYDEMGYVKEKVI